MTDAELDHVLMAAGFVPPKTPGLRRDLCDLLGVLARTGLPEHEAVSRWQRIRDDIALEDPRWIVTVQPWGYQIFGLGAPSDGFTSLGFTSLDSIETFLRLRRAAKAPTETS
jgi:hypothetical protein